LSDLATAPPSGLPDAGKPEQTRGRGRSSGFGMRPAVRRPGFLVSADREVPVRQLGVLCPPTGSMRCPLSRSYVETFWVALLFHPAAWVPYSVSLGSVAARQAWRD